MSSSSRLPVSSRAFRADRISSCLPHACERIAARRPELNGVVALFFVGRELHSRRAGLIAAVTYALWIPNILLTSQLWQEHLFVPLTVVGLAWFGRALRTRSLRDWTAAGIFLGAAALTRSSVAYFILPAALTCIVTTKPRRHVLAGVGVLLGSFALLTVPYSIFISRSVGQAVFIENIGLYALKRPPPSKWDLRLEDFMKTPTAAPTTQEALRYLRAELAQDRRDFVHERVDLVRLLLKPVGGTLLPTLSAPSQTASRALKVAVHALVDAPFIVAVVLAPFGMAVSRSPRFGAVLLLWVLQHLGMLVLTLWAGARFRAPIEPALIVLASVFLAGSWQRPRLAVAVGAVILSLTAGVFVARNLESVANGRANYGVHSWQIGQSTSAAFVGRAGVHLAVTRPELTLSFTPAEQSAIRPVEITVHIDGRHAGSFFGRTGAPIVLHYQLEQPGMRFVEVIATSNRDPIGMVLRQSGAVSER